MVYQMALPLATRVTDTYVGYSLVHNLTKILLIIFT